MTRGALGIGVLLAALCLAGCQEYEPEPTISPQTTSADAATIKSGKYVKPLGTRTKPAGEKNVKDGKR